MESALPSSRDSGSHRGRSSLRALFTLAIVCATALFPTPAQAKLRIFVSNSGDGTVSVIDGTVDREEAVIPVGSFPQGIAIRPRPYPLVAVANSHSNSITLIEPTGLHKFGDDIPLPGYPIDLAFSADGLLLFCTNENTKSVVVLDVDEGRPVGEPIPIGGVPRRLVLSNDGHTLYVLKYDEEGAVVAIDAHTRKVLRTVPVGPYPTDLALQPDGRRLFAASFNADKVTVIDTERLEVVDSFEATVGNGLLVHPHRPLLYSIATMDDAVQVIDYATKAEVATVPVGEKPTFSALSPNGAILYVVNSTDRNVMKLDTEQNAVQMRIAVGIEPAAAVVFEMPATSLRLQIVFTIVATGATLACGLLWLLRRPSRAQ